MTTIVALDLETSGLDPDRHHIWEIGAVVRDHRDPAYCGRWQIMMRPNLTDADPVALRVGRYYERAPRHFASRNGCGAYVIARPAALIGSAATPAPPPVAPIGETTRTAVAGWLAVILDGATIVGANPAFDAAFMTRFLRSHGHAPTWHHHLVDVAALAAGYLARTGDSVAPPWRTGDLAAALDLHCEPELRHTALGDADWALAIYDTVMGTHRDGSQ
ncbi:hypothetical protein ACGFI9_12215 [Micromonospora sp. NPDC048930]|uniref:3'-5' exonuclease n=1 Tax=Micromonospora sp. NPDC048930 TaxID=3364261 RepID=UPI0037192D37